MDFNEFFRLDELTSGDFLSALHNADDDGLTWAEAAEKVWCEKSAKYDFSEEIELGLLSKDEIGKAIDARDYLLATRIAIHNEQYPLSVALELDSDILLASLIFYYKNNDGIRRYETYDSYYDLGDHFEYDIFEYINKKSVLAEAVKENAHKCFLTLLLVCDDLDIDNSVMAMVSHEGNKIITTTYRPHDWLLSDKYLEIALHGGFIDVHEAFVRDDDGKTDLLVALLLENKELQANKLVELGWHSINPPVYEHDGYPTLLDIAIGDAKKGNFALLKWCSNTMMRHSIYAADVVKAIEHKCEILTLLKDEKSIHFSISKLSEAMDEYLAERTSLNILHNSQLSKLHHFPFKHNSFNEQQAENKPISIFNDAIRVHPKFFKKHSHISDLIIYFDSHNSLIVSVNECGKSNPNERAIVKANELSTFQKPLSTCRLEGTHLTDFQVQLAFLSLPLDELLESVFGAMLPVRSYNSYALADSEKTTIITVALTDEDEGVTSLVDFLDCEDMDDPCEVVFTDMAMWFPFDELPNRSGHIRRDGLCSPDDFITKAEDMGFKAKIINHGSFNHRH